MQDCILFDAIFYAFSGIYFALKNETQYMMYIFFWYMFASAYACEQILFLGINERSESCKAVKKNVCNSTHAYGGSCSQICALV